MKSDFFIFILHLTVYFSWMSLLAWASYYFIIFSGISAKHANEFGLVAKLQDQMCFLLAKSMNSIVVDIDVLLSSF